MPKFSVGDIVAFNTHPFSVASQDIIISGEYLMIPPIMIVVEIIVHGTVVDSGQTAKYKCLWYSTKTNQFRSNWLLEDDIKLVITSVGDVKPALSINDKVVLKSLDLELGKRRSFLNIESTGGTSKTKSSISSLLSFISPVMSVIEIKDFDEEIISKSKSITTHRKIYPSVVVKCKWFNSVDEKYSEEYVPLEALAKIPLISDQLIAKIKKVIEQKRFLKSKERLLKPVSLSNRSGQYYLECFDYVNQVNSNESVNGLESFKIVKKAYLESAPQFAEDKAKYLRLKTDIKSFLRKEVKLATFYLLIKYKDKFDSLTIRTVSNYSIVTGDDLDVNETKIKYLKAYCSLRQANRYFKIDNIIEISKLNLSYKK